MILLFKDDEDVEHELRIDCTPQTTAEDLIGRCEFAGVNVATHRIRVSRGHKAWMKNTFTLASLQWKAG